MKCIVTNSKSTKVRVGNITVGSIDKGMLILVGFTHNDDYEVIKKMVRKIVNLRIFPDDNDVMNKSIVDIEGSILSVSQFTLYADTKKGARPSYKDAMPGKDAKELYDLFNDELRKYVHVETGVFGENMVLENNNIGPTTIILEINNERK